MIGEPSNEHEAWLIQTVSHQAQAAGIGMPEVAIFPADGPNAFATGARRDNALVAVSSGLLRDMNRDEVEAVLAHEISHIANGDMITLTLIQGVVNTFVFFFSRVIGHYVDRVIFKTQRGHGIGYYVTTIIAQIALTILASVIVLWFSRQREFRADAGGASLAGRQQMIGALKRLQTNAPDESVMPEQMAALGIHGSKPKGLRALFMSHPPLEQRIAALEKNI